MINANLICSEIVSKLHGNTEAIYAVTRVAMATLAAKKDELRTSLGIGQMTPSDFAQSIINQVQNIDTASSTPTSSPLPDHGNSATRTPSSAASEPGDIQNVRVTESSPPAILEPVDQGISSGAPDSPGSVSSDRSPRTITPC